jgi:hypothetical protein
VAGLRSYYLPMSTTCDSPSIDNPDLAVHVSALGKRCMVHLLPVVMREIDDLKRGGKTQQLREAAQRADRRLKGLRDNGDVLSGARVAG